LRPLGGSQNVVLRALGKALSNTKSPYAVKRFSLAGLDCKPFERCILCGVGRSPFLKDLFDFHAAAGRRNAVFDVAGRA
jgi:hypothetical protein